MSPKQRFLQRTIIFRKEIVHDHRDTDLFSLCIAVFLTAAGATAVLCTVRSRFTEDSFKRIDSQARANPKV